MFVRRDRVVVYGRFRPRTPRSRRLLDAPAREVSNGLAIANADPGSTVTSAVMADASATEHGKMPKRFAEGVVGGGGGDDGAARCARDAIGRDAVRDPADAVGRPGGDSERDRERHSHPAARCQRGFGTTRGFGGVDVARSSERVTNARLEARRVDATSVGEREREAEVADLAASVRG